ncbi:MAG: stage III sporulation protein AD [Faecalibacterium sp.]
MNAAVSILGAALAAAVFYTALQKVSPSFAVLLSVGAAAVILLRLSTAFQSVVQGIVRLGQRADGEAFACLLKGAGILLLTDYARTLCEEAGAESLAWCTGLAGRCLVLAAAWPLLESICTRIWELTG